jgi:hypothetical protein
VTGAGDLFHWSLLANDTTVRDRQSLASCQTEHVILFRELDDVSQMWWIPRFGLRVHVVGGIYFFY